MVSYWALVHEDDGAFGVSFPDVPGCISAAERLEAALSSGAEALSSHLALMEADRDPMPEPRPIAALKADAEIAAWVEGGSWHLIASRAVQAPRLRVNIMIEPGLLRDADEAAKAAGMTRSGYIEAALQALTGRSNGPPEKTSLRRRA